MMRCCVTVLLLVLVLSVNAQRRRNKNRDDKPGQIVLQPGPDQCLYTFTVTGAQLEVRGRPLMIWGAGKIKKIVAEAFFIFFSSGV